MHRSGRHFTVALLCAATLSISVARAAELERVTFRSADEDDTRLTGYMLRPSGKGPFPAVIALHGCSGLWSSGARGTLSKRHADWGDRLVAAGYIVLFPDSFGSRGYGSLCRSRDRDIRPADRAYDALGAAAWLSRQPFAQKGRVAALGWSNGGSTVLHLVGHKAARRAFAAAIAFYPGCRVLLNKDDWEPRLPLLIQIGEADDWTPAAPCRELAGHNADIRLVTYPDAYHDFDAPDMPVRVIHGVAYSANGSGTVHTGTNEPARQAAIANTLTYLKERLEERPAARQ